MVKSFKEYLHEEKTPVQKAEEAMLAGDYETAKKYLAQHVTGKSRARDAYAAKLMMKLKQK